MFLEVRNMLQVRERGTPERKREHRNAMDLPFVFRPWKKSPALLTPLIGQLAVGESHALIVTMTPMWRARFQNDPKEEPLPGNLPPSPSQTPPSDDSSRQAVPPLSGHSSPRRVQRPSDQRP